MQDSNTNAEQAAEIIPASEELPGLPPTKPVGTSETEDTEGGIRTGSPFRQDPVAQKSGRMVPAFDPRHDGSKSFDIGIAAATAQGGLLASYCVLPFALVSLLLFPMGALLIGGLGTCLAIFALAGQKPALTVVALTVHLATGAIGYFQLL